MKLNQANPIYRSILLILTAAIVCSCSNYDNPTLSVTQGNFSITYNINAVMRDSDGQNYLLPDSLTEIGPIAIEFTDSESGNRHKWSDINEFSNNIFFRPGRYSIHAESSSDNGGLIFSADTIVNLRANETVGLDLTLSPYSTWIVNEIKSNSDYNLSAVKFHNQASGSTATTTPQTDEVFSEPGLTEVIAVITDPSGRSINLSLGNPTVLNNSTRYNLTSVLSGENVMTCKDEGGNINANVIITGDLFNNNAPVISLTGFTDGEAVAAVEGVTLSSPVTMTVTSKTPLNHLYFGVISPLVNLLNGSTEAFELDLMHPTAEQEEILNRSSLSVEFSNDKTEAVIDFTHAIEGLASVISARSIFNVTAVNSLGLVSESRSLVVDTETVGLEITNVTRAIVGVDEATVTVKSTLPGIETSDFSFETVDGIRCPLINSAVNSDGSYEIKIAVPEGLNPLEVSLNFVGLHRKSFTVYRSVPNFGVFPDGYATSARLKIVGENDRISRALTRLLSFTIDKGNVSVVSRDTTTCVVVINGLSPDRSYRLDAALGKLTPVQTAKFTTEKALAIPDGDFEDADPLIKFKHLPVGGRYAFSSLDVVNRQNFTDIEVYWPKKYWASINSRTFCTDAKHKNSWYMQPSSEIVWESASGYKSIAVKSVGWDLDGEEIADWVPAPGAPKAQYSNSVPVVRHRSAGRLFLGSYSFNPLTMAEIYNEGVPFNSRPSSLNGFFKYIPDTTVPSDKGLIKVELVRRDNNVSEVTVASGTLLFGSCPDFKSFNLPLDYERYDIRPTHLKIMILSSSKADETPIDDVEVPVTPHPEKGAYIGSVLTIDNLSFSY